MVWQTKAAGFSAEEHVSPDFWWTGDREQDPWEWREIIAASHEVAYGMPVSILRSPESIWGYDMVTAAYDQEPKASWKRLLGRVRELYPHADREAVIRLIGREPEE